VVAHEIRERPDVLRVQVAVFVADRVDELVVRLGRLLEVTLLTGPSERYLDGA